MLIGEYQHSLDDKGRVNFPAKLREGLGARFILTKGLDNTECLFAYSEDEWTVLENAIRSLPGPESSKIRRFVFAGAAEAVPDKQGRIVIPANLRDFAGLDREVMIIGASNHAEIWDKDRWLKTCGELTPEAVAMAMASIGF